MPVSPIYLIFFAILVFFFVLLEIDVLTFAFSRLGLSPDTGLLILFASRYFVSRRRGPPSRPLPHRPSGPGAIAPRPLPAPR